VRLIEESFVFIFLFLMETRESGKNWKGTVWLLFLFLIIVSCGKEKEHPQPPVAGYFYFSSLKVDNKFQGFTYYNVSRNPVIRVGFSAPLDRTSAGNVIQLSGAPFTFTFENHDSMIVIQPTSLNAITKYLLTIPITLKSSGGSTLQSPVSINLITSLDSTNKFPVISDAALLDLVQKQTFKYFWDFGDPTSGMARERKSDQVTVATGGTGFGIMAMIVAVNRNFITRTDAITRLLKIVNFLSTKAAPYHGAFSHWINGSTGATIPFGLLDNGGDIVETSYLMMGLLTARQFFSNPSDPAETDLRNKINDLWNAVEWTWYQQNNQNVLYWNWSPNYAWAVNVPVRGWNETLITYVMAASSNTHPIGKTVYDAGFANSGAIKNGNTYYGYILPLGPPLGGPLFFEHYSFLGIDPQNLSDAYCSSYLTQAKNHTLINYSYCRTNPKNYNGYSSQCWGLTASDIPNGYTASSPTNDVGVIAPTAALSSFPYTPEESMNALNFFYYVLGDKIWGEYGFKDAFNLTDIWFDNDYIAIDQGPIICMIENYRTKLLWTLFMSCPEIKTGMRNLGFSSPHF
jgi:hypothetical protein